MTSHNPHTESLRAFGLSDTNTLVNKDRLLYALYSSYNGTEDDIKEILKVLQDNPDRDKDKKAIMKRTERDSSITSTTGQGLGDVIDNMPYYVDSCAWWIKGWNAAKYAASLKRDKLRVRRKPVPRIANRGK